MAQDAPTRGTALTVQGAEASSRAPRKAVRPDAAFVAQLLAARAGLPDQRAKRRAAPERGAAAYQASLLLTSGPGRLVHET